MRAYMQTNTRAHMRLKGIGRRVAARMWRWLLAGRFWVFQRHRHRRLTLENIAGRSFVVLPDVFNPGIFQTGAFLAAQFAGHLPPGSTVLDMGTGSGIGAVCAAQHAAQVVAVDINPAAVRCAKINALLNNVEDRVQARQGDLFAPVAGEQFDVVLFNPPFFRGSPRDAYDHAWRSNDVPERFAAGLAAHLKPGGFALVVLSTNGEEAAFLNAFTSVHVIARQDLISEVVTVYQLRP